MRGLGTMALLGLALTVVFSGSAAGKIMVEISPRTAAPGDQVKVVAGWADPVGPFRRLRVYLVVPKGGLGNGSEVAQRLGPESRRRVAVLDSRPDKPDQLHATFTVPKVAPGSYGVDVCGNVRHCYRFGRLRVTGSTFRNVSASSRTSGAPVRKSFSTTRPSSVKAIGMVALLLAFAYIVLTVRKIAAREH